MNKPYFEVGETVILRSPNSPALGGEYIVEHSLPYGEHPNKFDSEFHNVRVTEAFGYKLVGIEPKDTTHGSGYFRQSSLKKKHKPFGKSFQELITNLQPTETTL